MKINGRYIWLLAAASLMSSTGMASANVLDNKTVRTSHDQIVRSAAFGTCVRTKWEQGTDVCAPAEKLTLEHKPVNTPVTVPVTVLKETEKNIFFEFDKATLTPQAKFKLDRLSHKLKLADDVKSAKMVGFADRIGNSSYNRRLSKKRAEAVKNHLTSRGYLNVQIAEIRALGESRPTTNCGDHLKREQAIECLSPDRRVEVEVEYTNIKKLSYAQ